MAARTSTARPQYPGWNHDLRWLHVTCRHLEGTIFPTGIHYNSEGAESAPLSVREVAMMLLMDRLTDKPDWHIKVFDDGIAETWKTDMEVLAWPSDYLWNQIANHHNMQWEEPWQPRRPKRILDKECFDYCIKELRHKACHFENTRITPTLDATFSIAKSDVLVSDDLRSDLRGAFAQLQADQAPNPDWYPDSDSTVQHLVDPIMYPLVYGRSRFLPDEVVGVEDAIDKFAGTGDVIPRRPDWGEEPRGRTGRSNHHPDEGDTRPGGSEIHRSYWSTIYQLLPANIKFTADGGVEFTSYINNLHPTKYRSIYTTIERLIETALPMWDQCLSQYTSKNHLGAGRYRPRLTPNDAAYPCFKALAEDLTEIYSNEKLGNWDPKSPIEMLAREAAAKRAEQQPEQPPNEEEGEAIDQEDSQDVEVEDEDRWYEIRRPVQLPLPAFSPSEVDYAVPPSMSLREQFEDTGLQIIVKLSSIELRPEQPEFAAENWHVEGMMNEHIVSTALYFLDSENITDSYIDFRTITNPHVDEDWDEIEEDPLQWLESIYGVKLGGFYNSSCLQNYGSVLMPPGRLLAFPNVFQHRASGFKLVDPTKPGHSRVVTLWLVDPYTRIISTANVPPQQADWWAESAFGAPGSKKDDVALSGVPPEVAQLLVERGLGGHELAEALTAGKLAEPKLPPELLSMVREGFEDGLPMSRQEAEGHRLKMKDYLTEFHGQALWNWKSVEYDFYQED